MNDTVTAPQERLSIPRLFSSPTVDPFDQVKWVKRDCVLTAPDGTEKFRLNDAEFPDFWSERACNIVAEKYFRVVKGVRETSARQMLRRVSETIAQAAYRQGLFGESGAAVFEAELRYLMLHQYFAFNSPVWFNVGVVENPQASACFIQRVEDTMEDLTDLQAKEVRLFKGGSGTGANLSKIRSSYEKLSGGGWASGPVSFMQGFDAWAGVTKSGGTTRRAAKMVMLDAAHPDILQQKSGTPGFIPCKAHAEQVARDLFSTGRYTAEFNVPGNVYELVPFQNANNSVRASDAFMQAVDEDREWQTKKVTSGESVHTYKAKDVFRKIAEAAWFCGDPGLQFDTTINEWHTCPASGRINGSNPCSEFMFLDDSACNLGSLNLLRFLDGDEFNVALFVHASQVATTAMEALVELAGYPSDAIAVNSATYRPLGLGYANLGALLLAMGIAYDSDHGRNVAAAVTAVMTGAAYVQSAKLAGVAGPFTGFAPNRDAMLGVIKKHLEATLEAQDPDYEDLEDLWDEAERLWEMALELGEAQGFRNAQVSVLAPTGTISFLMDCDTTGIEPSLALVVYKKLVGGGIVKMPNRLVQRALEALGYSPETIKQVVLYVDQHEDLVECPLLRGDDRKVFATAIGKNAIDASGHIKMMAAVQPFISGAISKTVNLPTTATVDDVWRVYVEAWKLGLKAIAIYRDGCKLSQPAGTKLATAQGGEPEAAPELKWGDRKKLPATRDSRTHKLRIGNAEGYITIGKHEDGTAGEIFITMAQEGSTLRGFMDLAATAISLGLQYGVPLERLIEKMKHMKFEPAGFTENPDIRMAESIPDYIGRWLELEFLRKAEKQDESKDLAEKHQEVVKTGFNGPACGKCGNLTQRAGTCWVCTSCGTTTGCG